MFRWSNAVLVVGEVVSKQNENTELKPRSNDHNQVRWYILLSHTLGSRLIHYIKP